MKQVWWVIFVLNLEKVTGGKLQHWSMLWIENTIAPFATGIKYNNFMLQRLHDIIDKYMSHFWKANVTYLHYRCSLCEKSEARMREACMPWRFSGKLHLKVKNLLNSFFFKSQIYVSVNSAFFAVRDRIRTKMERNILAYVEHSFDVVKHFLAFPALRREFLVFQ